VYVKILCIQHVFPCPPVLYASQLLSAQHFAGTYVSVSQSRSEPHPNIKGTRSFVPKIWKSVTFPNVTMSQFWTLWHFWVFVTPYIFFLVFLAKPKMSKKRRNVTNVANLQPLEGSFQTFRKYLSFEVRFDVVWLGQIDNLDTGHVYVLGLKCGSERLSCHAWMRRD